MSFRLGLIGCGRAAELLYVPSLAKVSSGAMVAVTDPLAERRELIAGQFGGGCKAFDSIESMLSGVELDGVVIATPPKMHVPMAAQVLEAGPAVLIEKPLAETLEQTAPLSAMPEAAQKKIMIGYNRRNWAPIRALKQAMASRDKAAPVSVDCVFDNDVRGWNPLTGMVDPLDDLATHHLDLLRFIFDADITAVSAQRPDERTITLTVKLTGNVTAKCHHAQGNETREWIEVNSGGRQWAVRMGSSRIAPAAGPVRKGLDLMDKVKNRLTGKKWQLGESYVLQFEQFIGAVKSGRTPSPGLHDGIAIIAATQAARDSAQAQGREIQIND